MSNAKKTVVALVIAASCAAVQQAQAQSVGDVCSDPLAARLIISKMNWAGLGGNPQTPPGVVNNPSATGVLTCRVLTVGQRDSGVVTVTWQIGQPLGTAVAHFVSDKPPGCDYQGARMHNATLTQFETEYRCDKRYYWK